VTTGGVEFFGEPEFQTQNPVKFLAFNLPYVLVPLLLLIRMRKPLPYPEVLTASSLVCGVFGNKKGTNKRTREVGSARGWDCATLGARAARVSAGVG
jgi:hypothetical protein